MTSQNLPDGLPVGLADFEAAARRIAGGVARTPTVFSQALSERFDAKIYLKLENLHRAGSFKERGALNKLLLMDAAVRARGVITASAGNHAQALALHARRLGVPAVIVMPEPTPQVKISQAEAHGPEIVLHGAVFDDCRDEALRIADDRGLTFVHPFDDLDVIAGAGTVGLELVADAPDIDLLVVPIGGGGLIAGAGAAARALRPGLEVVGVQPALYPSMYARFAREALPCGGDTIAEGISVKAPGMITAGIINQVVGDIWLAPERDLEDAVALLASAARTVAEGAGGAALAGLLGDPERARGRTIGLVISGGNIDPRLLADVLLRSLARAGRLARLRVGIQDRPGALAFVLGRFAAHQVNVVEIAHQRHFSSLPAKDVTIEIIGEARDAAAIDALVAALAGDGVAVDRVADRD